MCVGLVQCAFVHGGKTFRDAWLWGRARRETTYRNRGHAHVYNVWRYVHMSITITFGATRRYNVWRSAQSDGCTHPYSGQVLQTGRVCDLLVRATRRYNVWRYAQV